MELFSIRDTLAKVPLKHHTARVTRHALDLLAQQYRTPEPLLAKLLTIALGHDIGKIATLRQSGIYTMSDHPKISSSKLREIFAPYAVTQNLHWLDEALNSIEEHHRVSRNPLTNILQMADRKAREEEVQLMSRDITVQPWESWCKPADLLSIVAEKINVLERGQSSWRGISFEGVVYCKPEWMYEAAKKLANHRRVIDLVLVATSEKETAYRRLVETLRQADLLALDVGPGYYGLPFEIRSPHLKNPKKHALVPIKIEAFGQKAGEFEQMKEGILQTISSIKPARSGSLFP
ncbi:MAG: HD domain-containing protein [Nitrospirota bacterium]